MIEEFDLFANAPGFDRTLDATVELQVAGRVVLMARLRLLKLSVS